MTRRMHRNFHTTDGRSPALSQENFVSGPSCVIKLGQEGGQNAGSGTGERAVLDGVLELVPCA